MKPELPQPPPYEPRVLRLAGKWLVFQGVRTAEDERIVSSVGAKWCRTGAHWCVPAKLADYRRVEPVLGVGPGRWALSHEVSNWLFRLRSPDFYNAKQESLKRWRKSRGWHGRRRR